MAKFLFVYHGGKKPENPKEVEDVMAKWGGMARGHGRSGD